MTKLPDHIEQAIIRYLSGEANQAEIENIKEWIKIDENRKIFTNLKNIWDISHPVFNRKEIDEELALSNVIAKINNNEDRTKKVSKIGSILQKIAAIIVIPLLCISGYLFLESRDNNINDVVAYQEVYSPYGSRSLIILPDSSKVWLNAGSYIKYPLQFRENQRLVTLQGEAYFEVQSDKSHPFFVQTKSINIKATGTEFNVEAYDTDSITSVTLTHGVVDIISPIVTTKLNPGERIRYDNKNANYNLTKGDTYKWYAWKDGILAFRDDRLEYVFKRLGYMYNIDFVVKDKEVAQYIYRATFEGESLDEILNLLQSSAPIFYKRVGPRKDKNNFYQKQQIEVHKLK